MKQALSTGKRKINIMPNDINNARQNHPELIIRDLSSLVAPDIIRHILKFRGINKWLRVRRLLISLKHRWCDEINYFQEAVKGLKGKDKYYIRGYLQATIDHRQQIRALCHSPRDVNFPISPSDFGDICILPDTFPKKPHKRWFWKYDNNRVTQ